MISIAFDEVLRRRQRHHRAGQRCPGRGSQGPRAITNEQGRCSRSSSKGTGRQEHSIFFLEREDFSLSFSSFSLSREEGRDEKKWKKVERSRGEIQDEEKKKTSTAGTRCSRCSLSHPTKTQTSVSSSDIALDTRDLATERVESNSRVRERG